MAALLGRFAASTFGKHLIKHKVAYGITAATVGGTYAYDKYKQHKEQQTAGQGMDPTQPQSMMA